MNEKLKLLSGISSDLSMSATSPKRTATAENKCKWDTPLGSTTWDNDDRQSVKGLHMRVAKDGSRSWLFYYRTKTGKQRRPKIGDFEKISLGQARDLARALAAQVTLGKDPQAETEAERSRIKSGKIAAKSTLTVEDLFNAAFSGYWNSKRFHQSGRAAEAEKIWNRAIKEPFGNKKFDAITPAMIRTWKLRSENAPYSFNRSLEILSFIYALAEKDKMIPKESNPCLGIEPFTEMKRHRFAAPEELRLIWPALDIEAYKNPSAASFIKLAFLTGSRPYALHSARLENFRVMIRDGKRFGILEAAGKGTAKSGEDEIIVFSPEAMAIVDDLPKTYNGRMFLGTYPRCMWRRVIKRVGCPDLRLRDSRRTYATLGLSGGIGMSIISELLNHTNSEQTRAYAKLAPFARMDAAAMISANLTQITSASDTVS
jgi:integrase